MPSDLFTAFARTPGGATLDCRPKPMCDPRPVCPACGGLECLCRPRFFAGQLLTDEDLNRLDHYIVAKNRLHNRYLVGWGVACGLEVVCSVCEPGGGSNVVVRPGYALSPCGNDIVVCKEESVNVCDLINRCRPRLPDECLDPTGAGRTDCLQGSEQWVLAICYDEKPSRGVTALRGASGASCGCGDPSCSCGCKTATGSTQTGCGCGGTTAKATTKSVSPRRLPAQCEPTLTCEGYTFAVYKVPPRTREVDFGALVKRFLCCVQALMERLAPLPQTGSHQDLRQWLIDLIDALRDFFVTEGLYECDLAQKLAAVVVPATGDPDFIAKWQATTIEVVGIAVGVLRKCLCGALLPPCPDPSMADCVPIATLTVDRSPCRVRQVCNLSNRRFLLGFPTLLYWLSWLPAFQQWTGSKPGTTLGGLVERMCCPPVKEVLDTIRNSVSILRPQATPATAASAEAATPRAAAAGNPFGDILGGAFADREVPVNAATWLFAALGATDLKGAPLMSPLELQHPAEALLTHQVLAPSLAAMLPSAAVTRRAAAADTDEVSGLKLAVAELGKKLAEQQAQIDKLSRG